MRRVSSRQRFTIEDDFSAAAVVSDNEDDNESYQEQQVGLALFVQQPSSPSGTRKRVRAIRGRAISLDEKEQEQQPSCLKDALNDDLQLYIASFLSEQDVRTMLSVNSSYHRLLLSEDASQVWKELCFHRWGCCATSIPTPTPDHQEQHFSQLLQLASPSHPSQIDAKSFLSPLVQRLRQVRDRLPPPNFGLYKGHPNRVHFTGSVGTGDRCIKADAPLARPRPDDASRTSTTSSSSAIAKTNPLMDFLCRGAAGVVGGNGKVSSTTPFVAPYVNARSKTILTPRLVSYYEVSILEKPTTVDDTEPPALVRARIMNDNNDGQQQQQQQRTAYDCVAVGLSTANFSTHGRMPGWDHLSWGYHGDDGGLFHGCGDMLQRFGASFGQGDVVGCGVDYSNNGIFFTLNGKFLGYGWVNLQELSRLELYPTVGIDTNCPVHTNFGTTEPFEFDLEAFAKTRSEFAATRDASGKSGGASKSKTSSSFRRR